MQEAVSTGFSHPQKVKKQIAVRMMFLIPINICGDGKSYVEMSFLINTYEFRKQKNPGLSVRAPKVAGFLNII